MFWACSRCVYDARSDMWIDRRPSWCTDSKNFNTSECIRIMPSNLFCARADAVLPEFGRLWCRGEVLWYLWAADFPPLSVQDLCSISAVFVQALYSICEVQYLWAVDFAGRARENIQLNSEAFANLRLEFKAQVFGLSWRIFKWENYIYTHSIRNIESLEYPKFCTILVLNEVRYFDIQTHFISLWGVSKMQF